MFESLHLNRGAVTYSWLRLQRATLEFECAQLCAEGIGAQVRLGGGQSWCLLSRALLSRTRVLTVAYRSENRQQLQISMRDKRQPHVEEQRGNEVGEWKHGSCKCGCKVLVFGARFVG
jgi:hypothetical protein